eukprot:TRINITY_DN2297_c0_g2_i1.p1 TRINITY_DN2297_c0_g2~~TRINITY_DN2297_c0_g2_i1.p1  ORF type:complete len:318 (+),score=48.28 TRINITY_DN2297_c0_g2_i1:409-1362(+)
MCACDGAISGDKCPEWADCRRVAGPGRHVSLEGLPRQISINPSWMIFPDDMAFASIAVLPYCSQDVWIGQRDAPLPEAGGRYFAGHHIVTEVIQVLRSQFGLDAASSVLLSGVSAGGLGVFLHLDHLAAQLGPNVDVVGVANSGFFPELPPFPLSSSMPSLERFFASVVLVYNATASLPAACLAAHADSPGVCLSAPLLPRSVHRPVFVLQSLYDAFELFQLLGLDLTNGQEAHTYLMAFGANSTTLLTPYLRQPGLRTPVCSPPPCLTHPVRATHFVGGRSAREAVTCWHATRRPSCGVIAPYEDIHLQECPSAAT